MKYIALLILYSVTIADGDLPGVTVDPGEPLVVTGNSVHLVESYPSGLIPEPYVTETSLPSFAPPAEYDIVETLDCRFVIPDRDGIYPAIVSLGSESIEINADIELTLQAQQSVEYAPDWLQEHLIWKFSLLSEVNQDRFGSLLLAHQGENYYDELAFTIASLSYNLLSLTNWDETLLVDNARGIYDHDPYLSYVNVNDYGGTNYYSTTEYYTIDGSDTTWIEIPKEIYYNFVVMPKVSDERPLNDASVYNEFWRQYLWTMDDPGYSVFNQVLNQNVLVFWDQQQKSYGWSTTPVFSDSLHAVDIVSKWTRSIIPDAAAGNRPIQPNVIAHEHNGNCGETQDLLCAAGRLALIPTCCVMDINEDHVWCQIWWDGEWRGWYVDTINSQSCAYDVDYGGSKECSCIWAWRNDGFTWDEADYYSQYCTFTVTVTDSAAVPVDNASVHIASEGWGTTQVYRGTWGETDRNGQITFTLGNNQNYYMIIVTALGNFGAGGWQEVITNSIADHQYYFDWSPPALMTELELTEVPEGSWTKYLIQVNFELPADLMNGRDYYASLKSEYAEPLENGTADFFILDTVNWNLYQAGEQFDCYELIQGQSTGEVWFYAPHTDDWYIVFSGDRHQGLETFARAEITLWKHDGTGIGDGIHSDIIPSLFPNPCMGMTSVSFSTSTPGNAEVTLFDIHGRIVRVLCSDMLEAGIHELSFDTEGLSSGLYFVKFEGEGLNYLRSLTILR